MRGLPLLISTCVLALGLVMAPAAGAQGTGGVSFEAASAVKKRAKASSLPTATIGADGLAYAPVDAPSEVHRAIAAANKIVGKPYKYGGGHARVEDSGYDCSGTVSYGLIAAELLDTPLDSSGFMRWGERGRGQWITVYANPGHAYVVIAGLRLDTSAAGDPSGTKGPRWRPTLRSSRGYRARHPEGL